MSAPSAAVVRSLKTSALIAFLLCRFVLTIANDDHLRCQPDAESSLDLSDDPLDEVLDVVRPGLLAEIDEEVRVLFRYHDASPPRTLQPAILDHLSGEPA